MIICEGKTVTPADLAQIFRGILAEETDARLTYRSRTRRVKFPGICRHAQQLGVSRIHLYYVLIGERRSPRIEAYAAENMRRDHLKRDLGL